MLSMGNTRYGPLGQEIYKHMKKMGWRQKDLAIKAQVGQSTISKIMREENRATPDTLHAIGKVINVDPMHLMRLAGIPLPKDRRLRNPAIEHIAQRLDELPAQVQTPIITSIGAQIDAVEAMRSREQAKPYDQLLNGYGSGIEILEPIYEDDPVDVRARKFTKIVKEFEFLFPDEYEKIRQVLGDPRVVPLA